VLVLGETSHWDPNWLHTTEEYYQLCIPRIFERVLLALEQEPRRVFSIESLFFLATPLASPTRPSTNDYAA